MPKIIPSTTPIRKPRTVSSIVAVICCHSGPCAVPFVAHVQICAAIREGWPKKKESIQPRRAASSHPPISTTRKRDRRTLTAMRRRRAGAVQAGSPAGTLYASASCALFGAFITRHDLVAKDLPDALVQLHEARLEPDFGHATRPWEIDGIDALD